jgi:serine phosphatase RsbU (regulator of sigma subunit)
MKEILFIFLLTISALFSTGQNKIMDSLLSVLKSSKEDTSKIKSLNALSKLLWHTGDYINSQLYAKQAIDRTNKLPPSFNKQKDQYFSKAYINMGVANWYLGDYPKALENYFNCLKISEKIGNRDGISACLGNIGIVYRSQEDYPKALEFALKALRVAEMNSDKEGMARHYGNAGVAVEALKNYTLALDYHFKALKMDKEIGNPDGISRHLGNIGGVFSQMALAIEGTRKTSGKKLFDSLNNKSLNYLLRALKIDDSLGNKNGVARHSLNAGIIFLRQDKYKEAEKYMLSSLHLVNEIGALEGVQNCRLNLTELYNQKKDWKNALEQYRGYITARDSLLNEQNTKKTLQTQMQYDFDKKEGKLLAEQEKKDAIAASDKKKQMVITTSVIAGLLLVLLFAAFILRSLHITRNQKNIIEDQKTIVEHQKHKVEEHQREIIDSITYAKRLQQAILPSDEELKKYLPDSFLLYKPKDIVAGDFYWMEHLDETTYIAAADSTGHGVPGAMVSVVCSNALNRAVKEFGLRDTGKILDKTKELVLETFAKSGEEIKDGMDISLLSVGGKQISWSGANNQLWYISNDELLELTADKQPIGKTDHSRPFTTHSMELKKGDIYYLMTDGYPDQFGGPKGKKYKYKQLEEGLLANSSRVLAEQKNILEKSFDEWKGDLEQVDDVTIIGIKI